jgi:hypothetical protein
MTAKDLHAEVNCRNVAIENVLNAPRPGEWTVPKAVEWLVANLLLPLMKLNLSKTPERAAGSLQPIGIGNNVPTSNWTKKYPYLHLIHCIIDFNDMKTAHQNHLNMPSGRMALENRNQPAVLAANIWHMVAAKWNDNNIGEDYPFQFCTTNKYSF